MCVRCRSPQHYSQVAVARRARENSKTVAVLKQGAPPMPMVNVCAVMPVYGTHEHFTYFDFQTNRANHLQANHYPFIMVVVFVVIVVIADPSARSSPHPFKCANIAITVPLPHCHPQYMGKSYNFHIIFHRKCSTHAIFNVDSSHSMPFCSIAIVHLFHAFAVAWLSMAVSQDYHKLQSNGNGRRFSGLLKMQNYHCRSLPACAPCLRPHRLRHQYQMTPPVQHPTSIPQIKYSGCMRMYYINRNDTNHGKKL